MTKAIIIISNGTNGYRTERNSISILAASPSSFVHQITKRTRVHFPSKGSDTNSSGSHVVRKAGKLLDLLHTATTIIHQRHFT
ncbi:hypothetical protein RvY_04182 [Ramazzottius varieornatus]|uniref:Uncharacterized protein n=1 Tax=Ramazzottius varieornatus TaxID=947166 RepID=A0A1D1V005_RAMVA|nr:hypothetical protein RvY_04182 [Ramazzottius varieornatus]